MTRCTIRPLLHSNINFKTDGASRWSAQSIIKIMTAQHSFVHTVLYLATIVGLTSFHKAACDLDTKSVKIFLAAGAQPSLIPAGAKFEFVNNMH